MGPPRARTQVIYVDLVYWAISGRGRGPPCDSAPGAHPKPPSKFMHESTNSTALSTLISSLRPSSDLRVGTVASGLGWEVIGAPSKFMHESTNSTALSTLICYLRPRSDLRFRGGLVFEAHRLVYHSTLGWRVMKKKKT